MGWGGVEWGEMATEQQDTEPIFCLEISPCVSLPSTDRRPYIAIGQRGDTFLVFDNS